MLSFKMLFITFVVISSIISIGLFFKSYVYGIDPFTKFLSTPLPPSTTSNKVTTPTNSFVNNGNHFLNNPYNSISKFNIFSSTPLPPSTTSNKVTTPTNSFVNNGNHFLNNPYNSILKSNSSNSTSFNQDNRYLQNIKNNSLLPSLFNITSNSVVKVTAFNNNNHSIFKIGTGFVYANNGKSAIVTESNLVLGKNIVITLSDGSAYNSTLLGYDPLTTLAIISTKNIPQNKLIPLKVGNSTSLEPGRPVITIGNTIDFTNIISNGIISGIEKSIPTFGQNLSGPTPKIPNGIITNFNLVSGYGGSPLLNIKGEVIGMNTENFTSNSNNSPKYTGISFAIPANALSKIINSLLTKGYYSHPWLGAYGVNVDLDIAKALHLNETRGFLVIQAANSSPAKKAGILGGDNTTEIDGRKITIGGDIILKADNKNIQNIQEISNYIENKKNIGDDMLVTLLRNGIIQLIHVKLEANPNYFLPIK